MATKKRAKKRKTTKKDPRLTVTFWGVWDANSDTFAEGPWSESEGGRQTAIDTLEGYTGSSYSVRSFHFLAVGSRPSIPDDLIWIK